MKKLNITKEEINIVKKEVEIELPAYRKQSNFLGNDYFKIYILNDTIIEEELQIEKNHVSYRKYNFLSHDIIFNDMQKEISDSLEWEEALIKIEAYINVLKQSIVNLK